MKYVLSLDAGTTSIKGVLFDTAGNSVACDLVEYNLLKPRPDIVELDSETYWQALTTVVRNILDKSRVDPKTIIAMGVTSQGETLTVVGRDGRPLRRSIVWLDNRSRAEAAEIGETFDRDEVYRVTGQQEILPTWTATRIAWLRKNEPEVFHKAHKFLLVEDYLIYRLTGRYVSDHALNASTLYFDLTTNCWWEPMLKYLGITEEQLPSLKSSGNRAGTLTNTAAKALGLRPDTVVVTAPIDQVAGAVGAGNIKPGIVTETTGASLALCASFPQPTYDPQCRVALNGHAVQDHYVLFPWVPTAGMVLRWFRDELGDGADYDRLCREAADVAPGAEGLTVLPHLSGAGCPCPDPNMRGAFLGLTLGHRRGHLVRAILESVAFMLRGNLELLEELGTEIEEVRSLGGATRSDLWLQIKADVCRKDLIVMECEEAACLGVAMLCCVSSGVYGDLAEAKENMVRVKKQIWFDPENAEVYNRIYQQYQELQETQRSLQWNG